MSKVLEQTRCPRHLDCGSSDGFTVYLQDDGTMDATCFACNTFFHVVNDDIAKCKDTHTGAIIEYPRHPGVEKVTEERAFSFPEQQLGKLTVNDSLSHPIRELKDRGISFATCERYGVRVGVDTRDGVTPSYYLFPVSKSGDVTGFIKKTPSLPQPYQSIGDVSDADPFGLDTIPQKGKKLFITEGHEDALSVYQVLKENSTFDWEPAVLGIRGSKTRLNSLLKCTEILGAYDEIIIIFDNDAPGKEAAKELAKSLAGKAYIVSLPMKDPNSMLMAGKGDQLKWLCLTGAKKYQPDGIVNAKDMWDRYKETKEVEYYPFPTSMPLLNKKLYGAKAGTVTTIGAGTSIGKTTFMRELKHHFLTMTDQKIADIELEADVTETLKSLVGLSVSKRITLPDVKISEEEESEAYKSLFGSGRYTLYDYFGGMDDDSLFSKLRYFAHTGHKFIFLDHLSIIVSEYAAQGGERERIDTIMTKLAKLAKETGVCIFLVVHLKKSESSKESFEKGAIPDLDDLRGSSTIKQLSWDVIFLSRNTQHEDQECAKITEITSAKCRLTGDTGHAGYVKFDTNTGRYVSCQAPPNYKVKN